MSEIQQGTRVRVTYEGQYVAGPYGHRRIYVQTETGFGGGEHSIPTFADVEVISPPLPPEPPINTVMQDRHGQIWINPIPNAWKAITGERMVATWGDLNGLNGPVARLVPENERSRYTPATVDRRVLWLHGCDSATRWPVIGCRRGVNPNRPPAGLALGLFERCGEDCPQPGARWKRLRVSGEFDD